MVGVGYNIRVAVVFRIGGIVHRIVELYRIVGNRQRTAMFYLNTPVQPLAIAFIAGSIYSVLP